MFDDDDQDELRFQPRPYPFEPEPNHSAYTRRLAWLLLGVILGVSGLLAFQLAFISYTTTTTSTTTNLEPGNNFIRTVADIIFHSQSSSSSSSTSRSPSSTVSPTPSPTSSPTGSNSSSTSTSASPAPPSLTSSSSPSPSPSASDTNTPSSSSSSSSSSPSSSPKQQYVIMSSGCALRPCDEIPKHECSSGCDCQWDDTVNLCVYMIRDQNLRVGPQLPVPVEPVWNGSFDTFPKPLPAGFAGDPLPEAKGKFAYVTMISPFIYSPINDRRHYSCLGLALLTSIRITNPDPSIDFVVAVLISDDDHRFEDRINNRDPSKNRPLTEDELPMIIGPGVYDAFVSVGVKRFVLWRELDTSGKSMMGNWKQAFTKLRMWTLIEYERIMFLDADKLVFKNIDHLFYEEGDFVSPGDWNCANTKSALFPSGGFWVLQPSLKVYGVIEKYIAGPDPCGEKWFMGDQMIPRLLFTDISEVTSPNNILSLSPSQVARWDGDAQKFLGSRSQRVGRCGSTVSFSSHPSHRIDTIVTRDRQAYIPPTSTWKLLNMSYDVTTGVCGDGGFLLDDDRFNLANSSDGSWSRDDVFSVHMSCYKVKPSCVRLPEALEDAPKCLRDVFDRFYENLDKYDSKLLLAGLNIDEAAHNAHGGMKPYQVVNGVGVILDREGSNASAAQK